MAQCFLTAKIEERKKTNPDIYTYITRKMPRCANWEVANPPPTHTHTHTTTTTTTSTHPPLAPRHRQCFRADLPLRNIYRILPLPCVLSFAVGYNGHKHCGGDVDQLVESESEAADASSIPRCAKGFFSPRFNFQCRLSCDV